MSFDPNTDYYAALGLEESASADEIKRAYRRLARTYHPDSTGGDKDKESRFKEVSGAYEVLGDPDKRKQYDAMRAGPNLPPGFEFGFGATPGGSGFGGFDLGDLFSQVFSGARASSGSAPGGFQWSYSTGDMGPEPASRPRSRRRRKPPKTPPAAPSETTVRASDGSTLVKRGSNIYSDVRVGIDQAVMGAVVSVPTLKGKASVKIPPGTSSGAKLRLKGKGARDSHGKHGDHYVTVQIDVPKRIDDEATKLLVEFMRRTKGTK